MKQTFDFDSEDGLNITMNYDHDFTKIEEMEKNLCVPQNMKESLLALKFCKPFLLAMSCVF